MQVGLLTITIHLHAIGSLKDKHKIVKSLGERLEMIYCRPRKSKPKTMNDRPHWAGGGVNDGHLVNRQLDLIAEYVRQDG